MLVTRDAELAAYLRATASLLGLIRGERASTHTFAARRRRAEAKLNRTRALLAALGNPQSGFPVVHITGTSGKGSTSATIAAILTAAGYRVGLRTSPYMQVATEKLQIGPALIDAASFESLVCRVLETGRELFPCSRTGRLGYAEVWSALAMLWFAERQVDIAVVEVGAGGRFDTTNAVESVVSVITSVGLDHVRSLGPTIADIAWHKAGIIKPETAVVVGEAPGEAWTVIQDEARLRGARLLQAADLPLPDPELPGMGGAFQRVNARTALAVMAALGEAGFAISHQAAVAGIASARLPGRLEQMPNLSGPPVWIDGAHNADKIGALAKEFGAFSTHGQCPVIVLGVLGSKDATAIAAGLAPVASAIVCTEPTVIGKRAIGADELRRTVAATGYSGQLLAERIPALAVTRAEIIARELGASVLVTGSLYLAGQVRNRWYPDDEIVLQRTPFPVNARRAD